MAGDPAPQLDAGLLPSFPCIPPASCEGLGRGGRTTRPSGGSRWRLERCEAGHGLEAPPGAPPGDPPSSGLKPGVSIDRGSLWGVFPFLEAGRAGHPQGEPHENPPPPQQPGSGKSTGQAGAGPGGAGADTSDGLAHLSGQVPLGHGRVRDSGPGALPFLTKQRLEPEPGENRSQPQRRHRSGHCRKYHQRLEQQAPFPMSQAAPAAPG
jgi:hypothetical protein